MGFSFKTGKIFFFIPIVFLFHPFAVESQSQIAIENEAGIPFLTNISPKEYNANGQNWASVQDSNGLVYLANSGGVILQFDGVAWNSISVGNGSIVRDIQIDSSGYIFIGMQGEFGYINPDSSGKYVYRSLLHKVDCADNEFGDIWKIGVTNEHIYFLERHHLFRMQKKGLTDSLRTIHTINTRTRFHNLFKGRQNQLFVHQMDVGLMETDADSLHLVFNGDFFKNDLLAAVLPFRDNEWLVVTRKRGLFIYSDNGQIRPLKTTFDGLLRSSQLYHAIHLSDGNFAIASKFDGLFIITPNGALVHKIDETVGLANNTVWSVFEDSQKGLWLALNKGIAYVDYASPFTNFDERNGLKGSVHDVIRHNGKIYITTNYGLFVSESKKSSPGRMHFSQVPGINTSGWDMHSAWSSLFISANSGIFQLSGKRAQFLYKYDPWGFYQSKLDSQRIYIGLASGVASFYISDTGQLLNEGKIPGIDIEARTMAEDNKGNLWVASSYQGVLRAGSIFGYFNSGTPPTITHYDENSGLPGNMFALISEHNNEILFSTSRGIYLFDNAKERFALNPAFAELHQKKHSDETYMVAQADGAGNVWSHIGQRIVLNRPTNQDNFKLIDTLFRGIPEEEIQCIFPDENQFVWFGHRNGVFKYDKKKQHQAHSDFKALIREVVLNSRSVLPTNRSEVYRKNIPEIQYTPDNMLRFKFAAPFFTRPGQTVYQYQLINFDRGWSSWASETQKDYTNLPHGKYIFKLKAKNVYGQIRETIPYSFVISPPWYHTAWAYLIFILVIAGLTIVLARSLITYSHSKALAEHQRQEEQRRKTEETIRSQVAADFHDELGTRITRISLFSEILKNDLGEVSDSANGYLEKISKNADRLYGETRDFIWQLDPQKDTLMDFISRLKSFGDELFEDTDIQLEVKQHVDSPTQIKLGMDQRRNLIRIIKEAMHNALKYAQCKNIIFEISCHDNQIRFALSDDGIGFTQDNESDGIGLKNMHQRAKKIDATLKIKTQPNEGTRIELSMTI